MSPAADPRAACIIGVARKTWHPADAPDGAPEPLDMWEEMAWAAAEDAGEPDALAALESIDGVTDNASVLVSVRVTVTDMNGVNKPSEPYRMRVIVHEDDNGRMTGYDLKYPDGGN